MVRADAPCVPEPQVSETSPIAGQPDARALDRERWLAGVAAGLTGEPSQPRASDGRSMRVGRLLGLRLVRGEVELSRYEWGWLSRALRVAGNIELDVKPRGTFNPNPAQQNPETSEECTDIDGDTLEDERARAADDVLRDLLDRAAQAATSPSDGASAPGNSPGGGGGGGGGRYAPGTSDGYATPAEARRPLEDLQAEDRCVAGLSLMLDATSDLAGGLGLETAEASATLGRTGNLPQTQALLAAASKKIQCGRILLGAGTYKLLGRTQEECAELQRDVRGRGLRLGKLPTTAALEKLPAKWERALLGSDVNGELLQRVIRMVECRESGGACQLDLQFRVATEDAEPAAKKLDVAQMCGGQGDSLMKRLLGEKSNDPCRVQDVLDQVSQTKGLPVNLARSVAWTESNWRQWTRSGAAIGSYSGDHGLLQVNQKAWGHKYDFARIKSDMGYNARAGGDVLAWSYKYARARGYRGQDLWRATYAVYNGGPQAVHRPWRASRYSQHDRNYLRHLRNKPWESRTQTCGT